jgi:hypothetical protein
MRYDGDGYLEFIFNNEKSIYNDDCKKDHGWVYTGKDYVV